MKKKMRIVTTSMATFEDLAPPFNLRHPDPEENVATVKHILETAASSKPDIVLLPEAIKRAGLSDKHVPSIVEPLDGPTFSVLSEACRKGNFNLVAGHIVSEGEYIYNEAIVLNRKGQLVGRYKKNYLVQSEMDAKIIPGDEVPVFDLDCGRIGVSICFDINWPEMWTTFKKENVDLVCWVSAYEGGFPLKSLAWVNQYPIASAVYPYHGRIIDITGEVVASTSRWSRIVSYDLNLDRVLCHTDGQAHKIAEIQRKYGDQVTVKTYTEEHFILLENNIKDKTVLDILKEFEMISYADYIADCTRNRDAHLL